MTDWNKTCYVTGNPMSEKDNARFTYEFDAWVSEEGQKIVEEDARGSDPSIWTDCPGDYFAAFIFSTSSC